MTATRGWTEKEFRQAFHKWWLSLDNKFTAALEFKVSKYASIPVSRLETHQRKGLLEASTSGINWHLSDGSREKKPFDNCCFAEALAYVVVMYRVKERNNKTFYMVPIEHWPEEGSLKEKDCLEEWRKELI